ncbi:hypothetical protein HanPSC8_Chr08g0323701 [Helianthus annuus]|nr:hypothetical protein HanPSC8_Chr08g0323701 [Helianthus annuus]
MEHQYPQHEDLVQVMWLSLKTASAPSFFRTLPSVLGGLRRSIGGGGRTVAGGDRLSIGG